jgi:hypothetical protein
MTSGLVHAGPSVPSHRALTLVWIDAHEATIVRRVGGTPTLERIQSTVPAHHRATGHVRHEPGVRPGGGPPRTAGESHRLEHLARFLDAVAASVPPADDLLVIGPGVVREQLARRVQQRDRVHRVARVVSSAAAGRMTRRQLVARLHQAAGEETRRRTVGAYRWSAAPGAAAEHGRAGGPRRVVEKRRSRRSEDRGET